MIKLRKMRNKVRKKLLPFKFMISIYPLRFQNLKEDKDNTIDLNKIIDGEEIIQIIKGIQDGLDNKHKMIL